ncbi:MAG: HPr kinase/phosphorylase [Candidatus Methanomethylicaceae archaeon]
MPYPIELISPEEKRKLYSEVIRLPLYTRKANVYGCCIKFLTDSRFFADIWTDNFYTADENMRSHGRLIAVKDDSQPLHMKYDSLTKTAFAYNFDYYGWIKSIALAIAGDILEDAHEIHSVHGAVLDVDGSGVALIAPSGVGKTTHSWGMLRNARVRLVADDWFFVRVYERSALAYGSEKNCYVDAELGKIWSEYKEILERVTIDKRGRAVVNARWVVGSDGVVPLTKMRRVVLMKRDPKDPDVIRRITADEALDFLIKNNFYNPHQLVRDRRKSSLRGDFFKRLLSMVEVYVANTSEPPHLVQEEIFRTVASKN